MGLECGQCEHDLRGGHHPSCSRYIPPARCAICNKQLVDGDGEEYCPTHGSVAAVYNFDREASMHEKAAIFGYLETTAGKAGRDVVAERMRQIFEEGFGPARDDTYTDRQHDDQHAGGELAAAAACYCHPEPCMDDTRGVPFSWPWVRRWWKPTDRRRDLVKAGALILAEIERLDRIERKALVAE